MNLKNSKNIVFLRFIFKKYKFYSLLYKTMKKYCDRYLKYILQNIIPIRGFNYAGV